MNNLLIPFLTGLSTGGLSCFALQGGLFSSLLLASKSDARTKLYSIVSFLGAKVFAYSLFGLVLGLVGNFFTPSIKFSTVLNLLIAGFMVGVAFEALKIHPIFRYFLIQPPKFVRKLVKENSKKEGLLNGAVLGASTVLIPCGITQAMMALAISSQNALSGMTILAAFTLGTVPMFLFFGLTASKLSERYSQIMSKVIAGVLIIIASYTTVNSLRLLGINIVLGSGSVNGEQTAVSGTSANGSVQKLSVSLTDRGYVPDRLVVKKGIPVELEVKNEEAMGCIQAFVIPDLNVRKTVKPGESIKVNFTPKKTGKLGLTCSMGMYYGEIIVQ